VNICALDDLDEFALGNMTDLNETRVKYDNIWGVERDALGRSFPLDYPNLPICCVSMPIDIDSKF
jgi:hypothetical protein